MCSTSACLSFFSPVISYFNRVWAVIFFLKDFTGITISSLRATWRRSWQATYWCKQRPRLIWASLRSISQFTYGRRAGTDRLSDPPLFSPPTLCLHLWLPLHPSTHPSIHTRLGYLPPLRSRQTPPLDKSVLSTCHPLCGPAGSRSYSDDARLSLSRQSPSHQWNAAGSPAGEEPGAAFSFGARLCGMDLLWSEKSLSPWSAPRGLLRWTIGENVSRGEKIKIKCLWVGITPWEEMHRGKLDTSCRGGCA